MEEGSDTGSSEHPCVLLHVYSTVAVLQKGKAVHREGLTSIPGMRLEEGKLGPPRRSEASLSSLGLMISLRYTSNMCVADKEIGVYSMLALAWLLSVSHICLFPMGLLFG